MSMSFLDIVKEIAPDSMAKIDDHRRACAGKEVSRVALALCANGLTARSI